MFRNLLNVFQILGLWVWTVISATIGFIILPFVGQKRGIYISSQIWSTVILWIGGIKLKVNGLDNVSMDQPFIYASNHESSFDIPVLFKVMPIPLFFLAKAELKRIPLFGWFVSAVGMVFIERTNHERAMESLKKAGTEIKKGKNIISFPEGTRSRDGQMLMFKRGTFILAIENKIDVIPVAISGSFEVNPPGYKLRSGIITVDIGSPISVLEYTENEADVLATKVEREVRKMRVVR